MTINVEVTGLFTGTVKPLDSEGRQSAIGKKPVTGVQKVTQLGIIDDEQADLKVHGGPDKALHHYSANHYDQWRVDLPELAAKFAPGGFGENISTSGFAEPDLCIGDIFALGTARVQICQGRQPCWKLNTHIGSPEMVERFQKTGRTGWYYRVLDEGELALGDRFTLLERLNPRWTLDIVLAARFAKQIDPALARDLASVPELAEGWRKAFARKADRDYVEDTMARTIGLAAKAE